MRNKLSNSKIDDIIYLINLERYNFGGSQGNFDGDFALYFKNNKKELRKSFRKSNPQFYRNLNKQYKKILKNKKSEKKNG